MIIETANIPNYERAVARWPDATMLREYLRQIESSRHNGTHGIVEHVRSFIECVCLTILTEFKIPLQSSDPKTTDLLVEALKALGIHNSKGASKLDRVLSGFNKLTDAITEMRNENGPVAHGKDGFMDKLDSDSARAYLIVGNSVVGLLLNALEGKEPNLVATREPLTRFPHLSERIDRFVTVKSGIEFDGNTSVVTISASIANRKDSVELRFAPSQVLYALDRPAFVELLNQLPTSLPQDYTEPQTDAELSMSDELVEPPAGVSSATPVRTKAYNGRLRFLRNNLRQFCEKEGIASKNTAVNIDSILATIDQNIGIDWRDRDALRARVKVALRRLLTKPGADQALTRSTADKIMLWLQANLPNELSETEPSKHGEATPRPASRGAGK